MLRLRKPTDQSQKMNKPSFNIKKEEIKLYNPPPIDLQQNLKVTKPVKETTFHKRSKSSSLNIV